MMGRMNKCIIETELMEYYSELPAMMRIHLFVQMLSFLESYGQWLLLMAILLVSIIWLTKAVKEGLECSMNRGNNDVFSS